MPPVKKVDLLDEDTRERLAEALEAAGYGNIVQITADLNTWLKDMGSDMRVGKSAVGEYAKLKKQQREAYEIADQLLGEFDVERDTEIHAVLFQMIAANGVQLMKSVANEGEPLGPQSLSHMSRMLKDLMSSSIVREKLKDDERARIRKETEEAAKAAQIEKLESAERDGDISAEAHRKAREVLGFA